MSKAKFIDVLADISLSPPDVPTAKAALKLQRLLVKSPPDWPFPWTTEENRREVVKIKRLWRKQQMEQIKNYPEALL